MRKPHAAHSTSSSPMPAARRARRRRKFRAELWTNTLNVNLTGAFFSVQPALAGMRARRWGRIIFIASTAGLKAYALCRALCRGQARRDRADARAWRWKPPRTASPSMPSARATPRRRCWSRRWRASSATTKRSEAEARADARGQTIRKVVSSQPQEVADTVLWLCTRGQRQHHRPGDFAVGRRDMVSAPLPAIAEPQESDSKSRLRLWIRLLARQPADRRRGARAAEIAIQRHACRAST